MPVSKYYEKEWIAIAGFQATNQPAVSVHPKPVLQYSSHQIDSLIDRLKEMQSYDEPPTFIALQRAAKLVQEISPFLLTGLISEPQLLMAVGRGIDFRWVNGPKELQVHLPESEDNEPYVYWDNEEEYGSFDGCASTTILAMYNLIHGS